MCEVGEAGRRKPDLLHILLGSSLKKGNILSVLKPNLLPLTLGRAIARSLSHPATARWQPGRVAQNTLQLLVALSICTAIGLVQQGSVARLKMGGPQK